MRAWGWILVYLVGFTLFQLLLFRYFSDGRAFGGVSVESGETTGPGSIDRGQVARERGGVTDAGDHGVECPHCGTANADDQQYTYCRNCLAQLR